MVKFNVKCINLRLMKNPDICSKKLVFKVRETKNTSKSRVGYCIWVTWQSRHRFPGLILH